MPRSTLDVLSSDRVLVRVLGDTGFEPGTSSPIAAEVVSAQEWERLARRAQQGSPRDRAGVGLGLMLDCSDPAQRAFLMSRLPLVMRPLIGVSTERPYRRRMAEVCGAGPRGT